MPKTVNLEVARGVDEIQKDLVNAHACLAAFQRKVDFYTDRIAALEPQLEAARSRNALGAGLLTIDTATGIVKDEAEVQAEMAAAEGGK